MELTRSRIFSLMFLFIVGATSVFVIGMEAKQDSWVAILLATLCAMGLFQIYLALWQLYPDKNFIELVYTLIGKYPGHLVTFSYFLIIFNGTARGIRDFAELIKTTFLQETPMWAINLLFIATAMHILFKNVEILAKIAKILFVLIFIGLFSMYILSVISGNVSLYKLKPVLVTNYKSLLEAVPKCLIFPFSEAFLFTFIWRYYNDSISLKKVCYFSLITSGIILTLNNILIISVLGVVYATTATIPLLEVIRLINVGGILSKLDAVGVAILFAGGVIKMTLYYYTTTEILLTAFKIINQTHKNLVILCTGILLCIYSLAFNPNYPYHILMGLKLIVIYAAPVFFVLIPILLLVLGKIKIKITQLEVSKDDS